MSSALPLVFTLPPSNRHEILLLDTSSSLSLKALNKQIGTAMASSPNCAAFMGKFKAADAPAEQIQEMRLRWDTKGRDAKVWPEGTVVTEVCMLIDDGLFSWRRNGWEGGLGRWSPLSLFLPLPPCFPQHSPSHDREERAIRIVPLH